MATDWIIKGHAPLCEWLMQRNRR